MSMDTNEQLMPPASGDPKERTWVTPAEPPYTPEIHTPKLDHVLEYKLNQAKAAEERRKKPLVTSDEIAKGMNPNLKESDGT